MRAYVDTSVLLALEFGEPGAERLAATLTEYEQLVSSTLLEAEFRSALTREGRARSMVPLAGLGWIAPRRPLTPEIRQALGSGYVRGADLWHLACALFFATDPATLTFATLDQRQSEVATALGFQPLL